jgi:thioredoxin reductase
MWDVIIAGAGPAGLSAALILGRCCRRVLLCDAGTPRSWASHAIHGYLSRDGVDPNEFRAKARAELARYDTVTFRLVEVTRAARISSGGFTIGLREGADEQCRKLLLATGVLDELPRIIGVEKFFGTSVLPCPYCDGWEMRGSPIAAYGRRRRGFEMARAMTAWTQDIVLCTDGPSGLSSEELTALARNGIDVITQKIAELIGTDGQLERIRFVGGRELPRTAIFFDMPAHPQSNLAQQLGCLMTSKGGIKCGQYEASSVPGVYAAGNILRDVQLSIVAAAEGASAAFGINRALTREDFTRNTVGTNQVEHTGPS